MKLLVAGCSVAKELPTFIQNQIPGCTVKSVAAGGAGNKYISDSVVVSTGLEKFDVIYVSWSGFSRIDIPVSEVGVFKDWGAKSQVKDKTYIFSGGFGGWDHVKHTFADLLFTGLHKFQDHEQLHYNSLLEIVKTQEYLKSLGTPFYFTINHSQFTGSPDQMAQGDCEYGVSRYPKNQYLVNRIEFDRWLVNGEGMRDYLGKLDMISEDHIHPNNAGYEYWTGLFVDRLKNDKIL